jgi:hypothetical protein
MDRSRQKITDKKPLCDRTETQVVHFNKAGKNDETRYPGAAEQSQSILRRSPQPFTPTNCKQAKGRDAPHDAKKRACNQG